MPADFEISPLITPVPTEASEPPVAPVVPMKNKSTRLLKWLVLAAAGLVLLTIGVLWWGNGSFSDSDVVITVEAPEHATSGDEITYKIEYKNNTKVDLSNMQFRIFYPEDSIVLKDDKPTTPESEAFTIETLKPGESGTKELKIFLVGDKGSLKTARLNVVFNAGSLRSSFEKEVNATTTITMLPVTLTLVAPPTSVSGQPIQYIVDIRNDSGADLSDLKVILEYPDGLTVQKTNPIPSSSNRIWAISSLSQSSGKRITVDGTLIGNERDVKTVRALLQRNLNGQYVDYVRTDASTVISSPLLSISVAPDRGRDYVAFPGDTLRYTVTYSNNSRFTFIGLSLAVKLDGDMYDLAQLQSQQGVLESGTGTLMFEPTGVPDFSALPPNKTGTLTFSIPLKTGLSGVSLGGAKTFFVKATARFSTTNVPSGIDGSEVFATDSVTTKIGSQPSLTSAALYDDNAGSGPVPPKVGETTTYMVRWQLTNPGNDVRNTKVTAALPAGVTFAGDVTASNGVSPTYDTIRNLITWSVGTMPYGTGTGSPQYEATFKVSITPSSNQVGSSVKLVTSTTLSGTDSFTGQSITSSARDLTTDTVENHSGSGSVVQ